MKRCGIYISFGVLAIMWVLSQEGWTQNRIPPVAGVGGKTMAPVRIRSIGGIGQRELIKTPDYTTSISRGKAPAGNWAQITVTFEAVPEWINELVFQYYVLCYNKASERDSGRKEYTLFKGAVSHRDVARGKSRMSAMYLNPNTVARYGNVVAVAIEVLYNGEVVDLKSEEMGARIPKDWWKSPDLTVKDGYLLNRLQTPFAFINADDFEAVK
jgi:hypothetical protein